MNFCKTIKLRTQNCTSQIMRSDQNKRESEEINKNQAL